MKWDLFVRLLDQLPRLARLQLQGLGEPMMHPRFFEMVSHASERGIEVSTNTNLTFLDERRAASCVTSGLAELHASLDAATAPTYESIRIRTSFDRVVHYLRRLMAARRRMDSETPRVRIVCVIMRQNLAELEGLVRLAADLDIPAVFVQHLCHDFHEHSLPEHYQPMRKFVEEQTLLGVDDHVIAVHFERARAAAHDVGIDLRLPVPRSGSNNKSLRCDWPWTVSYIAFDGRAMPCCMVATPDRATLGDVTHESFDQLWNGNEYQSFRKALQSDQAPPVCQSCAIDQGTF